MISSLDPYLPAEPAYLAVEGAVATLWLNRPSRFNAIDIAMAERLHGLSQEIASREEVRVVVIAGQGRAFCAGGDVQLFVEHLDEPAEMVRPLLGQLHEFLLALRRMPKLVLARVQGVAAGAGLSLVGMCDFALAAEGARFVPAYSQLGVSPDGGGTIGLVGALGGRRAMQLFLAEEKGVSTREAADWGLVNAVVPAVELDRVTAEWAERLARNAPAAIAATKRLMMPEPEASLRTRLEAEEEALLRCMATDHYREGVRRFVAAAAAARAT